MWFNSVPFLIFFAVVYVLYLRLPHRWQNGMLLAASYYFYGCWDWRFLSLIFISTAIDYVAGIKIAASENPARRKAFLAISMASNLTILGFFKYFNFFADSLRQLLGGIGAPFLLPTLDIVLPVGISFYTFQSMSYAIDVYRRQIEPTRNLRDFALFVAYFPQLVAGPIERAKHLLPQVVSERRITRQQVRDGIFLFAWGMFKKVCIADALAPTVNSIFAKEGWVSGWEVVIALLAFSFQIYNDFSGYSDIARGTAKLMGFEIMVNFDLPYFARSPREFWRRWHISLSTWLRDYLYIPLGGNRKGTLRTYGNLLLTMTLGGLWHGAAWTFVIWGVYHGILLAINRLLEPLEDTFFSSATGLVKFFTDAARVAVMFLLTNLGWLLFRAQSLSQVGDMLRSLMGDWQMNWEVQYQFERFLVLVLILLLVQTVQLWKRDLCWIVTAPRHYQFLLAALVASHLFVLNVAGLPKANEFLYFQF